MRLHEFANAEAQLGLLRTILDNTWLAIAQQAEQEKRIEAERKAQAKLKPRSKKSSKGTSIRIPTPSPPTPIKPPAPIAKQPTPASSIPNPNVTSTPKAAPSTNPQLKQQQSIAMNNPYLASKTNSQTSNKPDTELQNDLKIRYFDKNVSGKENELALDDEHSKNGIAALKNRYAIS
jgi:hypothetical protein